MSSKQKNLLGWLAATGLACSSGYAATNEVNFNNIGGALPYVEIGTSAAEYRAEGGASGAAGDGYLSVTDARGSQRSSVLFNDLDNGLVVKAFSFECDLRIGGGTAQPADGFSLNYVRSTDPIVENGGPYAGTEGEADLPEEGSQTGLAIGFDTWQSGNHPGGITDVVGLSIRVDGTLITQLPVPLRPGNVWPGGTYDEVPYRNLATNSANYASSMQTGALSDEDLTGDGIVNGDDANAPQPPFADDAATWAKWIKNLKWEKFKAELDEQGKVKIFWKGVELTPAGGLATTFAPSPGRIVFGARTGGAWEAHHVDNLRLVTVPADNLVIGQAIGNPIGFSISSIDSGSAVAVTTGLTLTLNGNAVTPTSATKDGITTTVVYNNLTSPLPVGSTNTVVLAIRDTLGRTVTETRTFVTAPYVTFPASYAVDGVNTAQGGFNVRVHQSSTRNLPTTVARAEQQLNGLHGANIADLTAATGGVFAETGVINYSQIAADGSAEQNGAFSGNTTLPAERQIADNLIPGTPSAIEPTNPDGTYYTDNITAEITSYLHFATPGVYVLSFNSDDGFRTTLDRNFSEVLTSIIVGQADVGKGASDINATVYVPTAGYYPLRTVWFEGGGGASLEWSAQRIAPDTTARYLINDANPAAIKAYRSRTGTAPAAVSFISPARESGNNYLPTVSVIASVQDGSTAATGIEMLLDGAAVTAQSTKTGNTTTLTYVPASPLAGGNHQVIVRFTAGAQSYAGTNTFTVANVPVVASSLALPANAVNTANRGFLVKVVQQGNGESMGADTYRGLVHVAGLIGTPNVADSTPFTGPNGYYVESGVINYNQDAASTGVFPDDAGVPGIPGTGADGNPSTDNFSTEILTVLDLQPGVYAFNVNSDDGFVFTFGNPAEAFTLPTTVGEFSGGRGNGGGLNDGTTFYFQVTQAGLYPARLVWYEGGGGANCEFSARQFDPVTGVIRSGNLINAEGGIRAYQYPIASAGAPYVKSFAPARSGRASTATPYRAGTDAAVKVVIAHGVGAAPTGVTLTIDATNNVTPTITTAGNETTVSYTPAGGWAANSTHTAALTYSGRTVSWSFGIGSLRTPTFFIEAEDFDNAGASPAATSQMPYFGGALAGATSNDGTDYQRPNEGSSPIYRIGEDPQVPMDRTGDRDRGVNELAVNYKIGWVGADQWYQYTRTFPAGTYNVYAGLSHGDGADSATRIGGNLATVSGGTPTVVGSFFGPATGGWGNNALLPMMDSATTNTLATVELSGSKTLRFTTLNGDYDFILFVPAQTGGGSNATITRQENGDVVITWSSGTLQSSDTLGGTYAPVAGASSPYTVPAGTTVRFYKIQ